MEEQKKQENLTEEEKKANHIASEKRRRQNIRIGYDQIINSVPTLTKNQKSEGVILQKTVEYILQLQLENSELKAKLDSEHS
ncbi:hypothetical protein BB561_000902 [Smittium simulii]|uniref:BHLH domain-containing protein n=1 Tax=Smittium simulii TaxID=133385 RepID=A0A2T9YX40_9FUNG|nr:hypothetical protein BB561_000902 [Smittium simulii]